MKVRTLVFRKIISSSTCKRRSDWITLGHFDEMFSLPPEDMALAEIQATNNYVHQLNSKDFYHQSIFLIDLQNNELGQTNDVDLWRIASSQGFLSVVRIHLSKPVGLGTQSTQLKQSFHTFSASRFPNIQWKLYNTPELSDLILVGTSDQFSTLSKWTLGVTASSIIGKTYTYFCISMSMLNRRDLDKADCIDALSIRFSEKGDKTNAGELLKIRSILETLAKEQTGCTISPLCRVNGNDDIALFIEKIPVIVLLKLYAHFYHENLAIFQSVSDIITRIGVNMDSIPLPEPPYDSGYHTGASDDDSPLTRFCIDLSKRLNTCQEINRPPKKEWRRPLVSLGNALVHMSRSATLDELVYLLFPSLSAFLKNAESGKLIEKDDIVYLRFVELCVHTMEHLMRAEDHLSQYPEVRPVAYDIPVFALEYATGFLQRFSEVLLAQDSEKKQNYFLLVPDAELDVSTVELFQATIQLPGLLLITVPFSLLYEPKRLFAALCHELGHYVGESCRLRKERYTIYCKCLASEIAKYFFKHIEDSQGVFHEFLTEMVHQEISNRVELQQIRPTDVPLQEIEGYMKNLSDSLKDQQFCAQIVKAYVKNNPGKTHFLFPSKDALSDGKSRFDKRNSDLRICFRETYADICMLRFLNLEPNDYLNVVLLPGAEIHTPTFLRILVSLKAMGYSQDQIIAAVQAFDKLSDKDKSKAVTEINELQLQMDEGKLYSECMLQQYINACSEQLRFLVQSSDNKVLDSYQKMSKTKKDFDFNEILTEIDESRAKFLGSSK